MTEGEIGRLVVLLLVLQVPLALVWGWAADRWGKQRTLVVSVMVYALARLMLSVIATRWQLYALMPLEAAADISIYVLPVACLSDLVPRDKAANFMGLWLLTIALTAVVAPPLGGYIYDWAPRALPALVGLGMMGLATWLLTTGARAIRGYGEEGG